MNLHNGFGSICGTRLSSKNTYSADVDILYNQIVKGKTSDIVGGFLLEIFCHAGVMITKEYGRWIEED
jgi:hypothetical protein